ncbi:MAG: DNA methyltransferase [Patescibacteria group bacterium]|nr:DNA methyltransferase [Patescibacteria group bacterium]MDD4304525.1 DNA methyltransferase [Patescibacteria group bacterium]MDD4694885.1 DNA methyltransferase [Patescibacteria group bacterium]
MSQDKEILEKIQITQVPIEELKLNTENPRKWSKEQFNQLKESITRFGLVDPFICNSFPERHNVLIGGHFRYAVAMELGIDTLPVVYINIPDIEKEKELNIRLNKNQGEFDYDLLSKFDPNFLTDIGFDSLDLDKIFDIETGKEEIFNIENELKKLNITEITVQKGDVYALGDSKIMCGDSTIEEDMMKLMGNEKADFCLTDPPYILNYLQGKTRHGEATVGFGAKKNRRYLETESLPDNFTELWMGNVSKVANENFSIIVYENWKNIMTIWNEMAKYWKIKNMLVWHLNNRMQGFSAKYKFFNKYDIAVVGSSDTDIEYNLEDEGEGLQNEYETALFAIAGKPQWESYEKGKKYCPTDFIEYRASDEKSSGQGIIFGTKPVEILIPYIKVLTKRDQLVLEPFGGSGSTLIAANKLSRRCFLMEKSPIYAEVIINRWERAFGGRRVKLYDPESSST